METAFGNIENRKYFADVPDVQHLADVGHLCASVIFLPNMWVVDGTYLFCFNGKEGDHTLKGDKIITQNSKIGTGNSYDFGATMYDPGNPPVSPFVIPFKIFGIESTGQTIEFYTNIGFGAYSLLRFPLATPIEKNETIINLGIWTFGLINQEKK